MKNTIFKKVNPENCIIELDHSSLVCTNAHYGDYYGAPEYEMKAAIKDKKTGKVVDNFTFEFTENGIQDLDDEVEFRRYIMENYSDIDCDEYDEEPEEMWNDEEDDYEATVIYNNMSNKQQEEVDKKFDEYIKEFNLECFDFYYFEHNTAESTLWDCYFEDEEEKFYSIGANGTVILYDVEDAEWNDVGDKLLIGKNIKRVFNINEEAFLEKQGNTVFSVNYDGSIVYYEKEKGVEEPDYLEVGENFGFNANKNNCGFFVEAE